MTLNLVVPLGEVRFVFYLQEKSDDYRLEDVGETRYARLTVPPGIWFGFQGMAPGRSLLMNIADLVHDPEEVLLKPFFKFNYNWSAE